MPGLLSSVEASLVENWTGIVSSPDAFFVAAALAESKEKGLTSLVGLIVLSMLDSTIEFLNHWIASASLAPVFFL